MLSKQSLHSARLILYIFHSELNVIACVVLKCYIVHLKAKELAYDPRPPSDGMKTGSGAIP